MIGQISALKQIDNLIKSGFPRFIIITGQKGQGKTKLANRIATKLNILMIEIGNKTDNIRDMIQMSYKQAEPIIYLIQDADNMSLNAKNSLLKVIEEPPNNAYFIMELQQIENTLETIKSRCQEIKMDKYTDKELHQMIDKLNPNLTESELLLLKEIGENYYQLEMLIKYDIKDFYNYVTKVYENIYKVQSANSFKLSEKLDIKNTGDGYDLELFFNTYCYIAYNDMLSCTADNFNEIIDKIAKCIQITCNYKNKLRISNINKQFLLDNWILDIRKEWLTL